MKTINMNDIIHFKNNKTYTNIIELWYLVDDERENIAYKSIIPHLILNTSLKYNNKILMEKAYLKNYILDIFAKFITIGDKRFLYFRLNIPQKNKIKNFNIKESINLFLDNIYNPLVKNNEFVKFDEELEKLKKEIKHIDKSKKDSAIQEILKILDTDGYLTKNLYHNKEQLDKITNNDTYKYYKNIISKRPLIFLYGNDELLEVKDILEKYFVSYKADLITLNKGNHFLKPNKEIKNIEVSKNYNQSFLILVYKINNMKEKDKNYLNIIRKLFVSNSTRLLFNKLRLENNLVYSANAHSYENEGLFIIDCDIYKDSKEETLKCVEDLFKELKNNDNLNDLLDKIKTSNEINHIRKLDSKYYLFTNKVYDYFKVIRNSRKVIKDENSVTNIEIKEFIDKLKLDLVYFVKGDNNE